MRILSKFFTSTKPVTKEPEVITLKQALQLIENKQAITNLICYVGSDDKSIYFEHNITTYECRLTSIDCYTDVTFFDLCQFSQPWGRRAAFILTRFLALVNDADAPDTKDKLLKSFLSTNAIDGLVTVTNLHFMRAILASEILIKYLGLPQKQYTIHTLNECMLDDIDFSSAIELSKRRGMHPKENDREGSYDYNDEKLYKYAQSLPFYLSEQEKITRLQKKAIEMKGYQPVPETDYWPGRGACIELVSFLQQSSPNKSHDEEPAEIFSSGLVAIHGAEGSYSLAMKHHRLPMPGDKKRTGWIYGGCFSVTLSEFKEPESELDLSIQNGLRESGR